jgi:hypothetical protein
MPFIIGFGNRVARDDCDWRFSGALEQKHRRSILPDRLAVLVRREMFLFGFAESSAPCSCSCSCSYSKRPSIPIRFIGLQVAANGLDQRSAWPQFKPLSSTSTVSQSTTKSDAMHDQAIYLRRCFFLGWEIPPTVSAILDSPLLSVLFVCFAREIF